MANEVARSLRKRPTIAEALLWDELRELRRQGHHFRRQAPVDAFIVDFACFAQKLVIEVDGTHHESDENQKRSDSARDATLRHLGFNVLRISNGDVMDNRDGVMLDILAALGAVVRHDRDDEPIIAPPLSHPRKGEEDARAGSPVRNHAHGTVQPRDHK